MIQVIFISVPPQININPSGGLCKLILPFWVHNIESILELDMQDKTLQGVIDLQNGLVVATDSLKIEQPEGKQQTYFNYVIKFNMFGVPIHSRRFFALGESQNVVNGTCWVSQRNQT